MRRSPVSRVFARATWSDGRAVGYSTDRFAAGLGLLALVPWAASVVLAFVGPFSAALALLGASVLIRSSAQWRLGRVAARLEATASAEELAAATAVPIMGRYCAWAARLYDRSALKLAARAERADATGAESKAWQQRRRAESKAWNLRRRAKQEKEAADKLRGLIDRW